MNLRMGIAVFLLLVSVSAAAGSVEFPLVQSLSYFPFEDSLDPDPGQWSLVLVPRYSNIYAFEDTLATVNDMEMFSFTLGFAYGFSGGLNLEVYLRYQSVFGGFLDQTIEGFHELFLLPGARRDRFDRNQVHYWLDDMFEYRRTTGVLSPPVLSLIKEFTFENSLSLGVRVFAGIPLVSKPGFTSDKLFWGPGFRLSWEKADFRIRLEALLSFFRHPHWLTRENVAHQIAALNLRVSLRRWSIGAGLKTTPFKEGDLAHNAHRAFIAYRFSETVEFGIVEDLWLFDTTPDISFYLRIRLR